MLVEARAFNPCVTGSNPVRPTSGNRSSSKKALIRPQAFRGERRRFAALRVAGGASSRGVRRRRRVAVATVVIIVAALILVVIILPFPAGNASRSQPLNPFPRLRPDLCKQPLLPVRNLVSEERAFAIRRVRKGMQSGYAMLGRWPLHQIRASEAPSRRGPPTGSSLASLPPGRASGSYWGRGRRSRPCLQNPEPPDEGGRTGVAERYSHDSTSLPSTSSTTDVERGRGSSEGLTWKERLALRVSTAVHSYPCRKSGKNSCLLMSPVIPALEATPSTSSSGSISTSSPTSCPGSR